MKDAILVEHMPGDQVVVGGGVPAVVTAVTVRERSRVFYEVVWWDGRTRKCESLEPMEVMPAGRARANPIGFTKEVRR